MYRPLALRAGMQQLLDSYQGDSVCSLPPASTSPHTSPEVHPPVFERLQQRPPCCGRVQKELPLLASAVVMHDDSRSFCVIYLFDAIAPQATVLHVSAAKSAKFCVCHVRQHQRLLWVLSFTFQSSARLSATHTPLLAGGAPLPRRQRRLGGILDHMVRNGVQSRPRYRFV